MRVGFIVESGPHKGAERKVIPYLAKQICPDIISHVVTLNNKTILKRNCGEVTKTLLNKNYERVFILWDLLPDWNEYKGKGCLHVDREEIDKSLHAEGLSINDSRIHLVCIHKMLEAWLIADERAIASFLSTIAHPISIPRKKNTEKIKDPKSALIRVFKTSTSRISRYEDTIHAIKIVEAMPDLNRLKRLPSFKRFAEKLEQ